MGFRSLQHSRVRRSTGRERCRRPLRSALRVWLPSRRFTLSEPVPVLFHTGGALGIRPSELSPLGRYPPRLRAERPTYRLTRRCSRRRSDGPAQRAAVSGLSPFRESLATDAGLVRQPLDAPLGFTLLGYSGGNLVRAFTRTPPTRFTAAVLTGGDRRRPGVSIGLRSVPPVGAASRSTARTTLLGFSHRYIPNIRAELGPGYSFTLRRAAHCCRLSGALWALVPLYRSCPGGT